jgi:predicted ABC-type ATPase
MEYIIIAGINGAGKSSVYHAGKLKIDKNSVRVNSDELIHREYNHNWQDEIIQIKAGKEILKLVQDCISKKLSFNQETTLAGRNIYRTILKVKELGYCVSIYYVGLESADLAIQRVQYRVTKGGHGIDEQIIRDRYVKSFENLVEILPLCDNINIYDNSGDFEPVVNIKDRTIEYLNDNIPLYFLDIIEYIKKIFN